jgi:hypothetical protein
VTSEALGSYPCGRLGPCLHLRICLCVRATGWYTTPVWCLEAACESCHAVVRSIGDSIVPGYSMTLGSALILCVGLLCCHTRQLNQGKCLSHSSGGWRSKIKVSAGLVCSWASAHGLQMATFLLCPHRAFSHPQCLSLYPSFLSYKKRWG